MLLLKALNLEIKQAYTVVYIGLFKCCFSKEALVFYYFICIHLVLIIRDKWQ